MIPGMFLNEGVLGSLGSEISLGIYVYVYTYTYIHIFMYTYNFFRSHTVNRLYVNFKTRRWRSKKEAYPLQTL